jgi:hypothetical protein
MPFETRIITGFPLWFTREAKELITGINFGIHLKIILRGRLVGNVSTIEENHACRGVLFLAY